MKTDEMLLILVNRIRNGVSLQILPSSGSFPTLRHLIIMGPEKVIASSHPPDD